MGRHVCLKYLWRRELRGARAQCFRFPPRVRRVCHLDATRLQAGGRRRRRAAAGGEAGRRARYTASPPAAPPNVAPAANALTNQSSMHLPSISGPPLLTHGGCVSRLLQGAITSADAHGIVLTAITLCLLCLLGGSVWWWCRRQRTKRRADQQVLVVPIQQDFDKSF